MTKTEVGCLDSVGERPRVPESFTVEANDTDPDCDQKFEYCATLLQAAILTEWIQRAQRWMSEADAACAAIGGKER